MTFRKKVASFFYGLGNAFEASRITSSRGNPNSGQPTDAKYELTSYTRTELVRKSRYLEKNSGHIRGILRDLKVYGIGKGIFPNAKSDNQDWNKLAEDWFFRWSRRCEISNRFSWKECQSMILRALIVDGEIFVVKVFDSFGRPKIQIVESHRLMSPDKEATPNVVDGIEFDAHGRALNYYFLIDDKQETTKVPAIAVLHIFDAERVSQSRAYPQIQHSINDIIDRKEILALEKKKVKAISDIVHIIKGGNISTDGDYIVQAIMDAVAQALYALYELLWEFIEMLLEMIQQLFAMIEALWAAINALWGALSDLAASLMETFSNVLDALGQDLGNQISDLGAEIGELWQELGIIDADLNDLTEILKDLIEKTTFVNVIDNQGKAITIKVLEKTGVDIDMRQQLNWVHGITGTSYQAKALYWDLTTPTGIKPVQVQLCENNQTIYRNFLEKP